MTNYGKPELSYNEQKKLLSDAYWQFWNEDEQKRIDDDIEKNRKADSSISLGIPEGTEVRVEQISHDYLFGAHIFNFDQLGDCESNRRYRDLYGELFNSATIPFYWKTLEPEEGMPRFEEAVRDTEEYWSSCLEPKSEPHWRRPATDPLVDFCEKKGVRLHGHVMTWGNHKWQYPGWLYRKIPAEYRTQEEVFTDNDDSTPFADQSAEEVAELLPEFTQTLHHSMINRIIDLSMRYGDRIHSWDIVNESAIDYERGLMTVGAKICKSRYGLMPGDYAYHSLNAAESYLPDNVILNINDYHLEESYVRQTIELIERGCKIDIMGAQMHLFDPACCAAIAEGKGWKAQSPDDERRALELLEKANLPIHMSEITITSPGDDIKGQAIQSVITRNLYRLWFSHKSTMGITWWNVVDGCGAPGEPALSGMFLRNMQPKLVYYTLNSLINNEWKTDTTVKANSDGVVEFRGFKGSYKLTWLDKDGEECKSEFKLK